MGLGFESSSVGAEAGKVGAGKRREGGIGLKEGRKGGLTEKLVLGGARARGPGQRHSTRAQRPGTPWRGCYIQKM